MAAREQPEQVQGDRQSMETRLTLPQPREGTGQAERLHQAQLWVQAMVTGWVQGAATAPAPHGPRRPGWMWAHSEPTMCGAGTAVEPLQDGMMALQGLTWGPGGNPGELIWALGPWAGFGKPQESAMSPFTMGRLGEPWAPQDSDRSVG